MSHRKHGNHGNKKMKNEELRMKNAARKREQNRVYLSYAEREQYRCEASMKNSKTRQVCFIGFAKKSLKIYFRHGLKPRNSGAVKVESNVFELC